jgi:hypothetical protein
MNTTTACMSEAAQLRPTPYGEVFDVVLSDIAPAQLAAYRAVLLVGDLDFNSSQLVKALGATVEAGGELLLQAYHVAGLRAAKDARWFAMAERDGKISVLPDRLKWAAQLPPVLRNLTERLLPVSVRVGLYPIVTLEKQLSNMI